MNQNQKPCQCPNGPELRQSIPQGFRGQVTCAKCCGIAILPRPEKKYEGKDAVEGYLFDISKNTSGLTFEAAILTMLLRIEKAILGEKGKK
jgi:hypothetical protein